MNEINYADNINFINVINNYQNNINFINEPECGVCYNTYGGNILRDGAIFHPNILPECKCKHAVCMGCCENLMKTQYELFKGNLIDNFFVKCPMCRIDWTPFMLMFYKKDNMIILPTDLENEEDSEEDDLESEIEDDTDDDDGWENIYRNSEIRYYEYETGRNSSIRIYQNQQGQGQLIYRCINGVETLYPNSILIGNYNREDRVRVVPDNYHFRENDYEMFPFEDNE